MRGSRQLRLPPEISSPVFLASYLASSGWDLSLTDDSRMIWTTPSKDRRSRTLMLPLDPSFADYDERFNELVARLCDINAWDVEELALNIIKSRSDLLFVRADQSTYADSIPLRQAENLLSGSADLLLSAARAAISPKPHYRGKFPDQATEFMDQDVRMGHTRRGSFVLTIFTSLVDRESRPVTHRSKTEMKQDEATQAHDSDSEISDSELHDVEAIRAEAVQAAEIGIESRSQNQQYAVSGSSDRLTRVPPFQRRVMSTLAKGLSAARDVASQSNHSSIDDAVSAGMSSNMLDSLDRMSQFEGLKALDMTFQWSTLEPTPRDLPNRIILPHEIFGTFKATSNRLKEIPESRRQETLVGRVSRIDVDDEDHASGEGTFRIRGMTGKADQSANMRLAGEPYALAYKALRSRQLIIATGNLEKVKGVWWMTGDVTVEEAPS